MVYIYTRQGRQGGNKVRKLEGGIEWEGWQAGKAGS